MNPNSHLLSALGLFACAVLHYSTPVRASDWPSTDMPPVVLRDTRPDEWPDLRGRIETRLGIYFGKRPPSALRDEVKFEEVGRDLIAGLTRIRYRYLEMDETWSEAFIVWHLLGAANKVSLLLHGDGHDTVDEVHATAYGWIERWLPVKTPDAKPAAGAVK